MQQYGRQDNKPVAMEAEIDATQAYVYQNLILTLNVISSGNLASLDFTLPHSDLFIFKTLGERSASARGSDSNREIVTKTQYLVIPLREGSFNLDELTASGRTSSGRDFEIKLPTPLRLDIAPPEPGVQPWLPVEDLTLNARLSNEENLKQGKPASLVLEMSAVGFTGAQLPTFEKQLKSAGLRVYREKTETEGKLKYDGKLHGKRTEYYTLLPGEDDKLFLPSIKVQWWNLKTSQAESTLLPMRMLGDNRHRTGLSGLGGTASSNGFAWYFWLPLLVIAFLTGLYWSLLWASGKSFGRRYAGHILTVTEPVRRKAVFWLNKLSPRRQLHRLRRFIAHSLPRSWRLWYCVRVADNESDPEVWLQVLRFLAERRLGIPAQISLDRMAARFIEIHPRSNADKMHTLLQRLDAAIFGKMPMTDFDTWKRQFKREIRPRLLPAVSRRPTGRFREGLPALNP
jgi:hypothetical protein